MGRTRTLVGGSVFAAATTLALLVACDEGRHADAQDPREPSPASTATPSAPSAIALHMSGRFAFATDLRDALVRGDLREANRLGRELAQPVRLAGLPPEANAHVVGVHVRAQEVAEASSLLDASAAFASLMTSCADCHAAAHVELTTAAGPLPSPARRAGGPMARHEEAVDAMWEGLLVGSSERFDTGARLLANAPLTAPEQGQDAQLRRLADRARSYARAATRAPGLDGRAEQFGLLLSTCAECHATARR